MTEMEAFQGLVKRIEDVLPDAVKKAGISFGHLVIETEAAGIVDLLTYLRDHETFRLLIDICGVDRPARAARFDVVYHLLSLSRNLRVRIKLALAEGEDVPSATGVFPAAGWFERETFDMYGIVFADSPDLRRILTDYGFEGHPLRKDFPLTGFVEPCYDDEAKAVVYKPVELVQEYRSFDFASPWEGPGKPVPQPAPQSGPAPGTDKK